MGKNYKGFFFYLLNSTASLYAQLSLAQEVKKKNHRKKPTQKTFHEHVSHYYAKLHDNRKEI